MDDEAIFEAAERELVVLGELIRAMNRLPKDSATRERVLRYLLARFWPGDVERICFIGKAATPFADSPK